MPTNKPPFWLGVVAAVGAIALTTLVVYPLKGVAADISLSVVYLLAVLFIASYWGAWLAVATAFMSALAFNFFHIPPTGRLTVANGEDWVALVVFLAAAIVASALANAARSRALEADQERVVPALEALLAAALERDALLSDVVETRALRRSDVLKTALLRAVSHDLRTPLTAILAAAEPLGGEHLDDDERRELAAGVRLEAQRLSRLIDQLLDLSRLEAQAVEVRRDWCSIEEVLRAAVDEVAAPVQFSLSIDPDIPLVQADAAQLERAFVNLLENSARHAGGHPVSVRAQTSTCASWHSAAHPASGGDH